MGGGVRSTTLECSNILTFVVFTCQKPQPKRCSFFLWADDAKIREESAVINNSRTEAHISVEPKTPQKTAYAHPPTPFSRAGSEALSSKPSQRTLWSPMKISYEPDEDFDWSSSGDEELAMMAEDAVKVDEGGSPYKKARTPLFTSPSKRKYEELGGSSKSDNTWPYSDDVFLTPTTSTRSIGPLSPEMHPNRPQSDGVPHSPSSLVSEAMKVLKPANLAKKIEQDLTEVLNRHDLRTQGIARGRDITRLAVQAKDKKIAELQSRVTMLEAERETSRTVIAHLKQDIATSPKRPGRSRFGSRSEI